MIFPASPDALAVEIDRLVETGNPLAFCLRWRMTRGNQDPGSGGGSGFGEGFGFGGPGSQAQPRLHTGNGHGAGVVVTEFHGGDVAGVGP